MNPYIVLLTDLGLNDPYVGQIRGVLHSLAPDVRVLDLSHSVPRHDVRTGAFFLVSSLPYYAPLPICLIVVDPGVGSERTLLCLHSGERVCLAPNNGFLSLVAKNYIWDGLVSIDPQRVRRDLGLPALSKTFHGRDILAPLGARLALGEDIHAFGDPVAMAELRSSAWSEPVRTEDGVKATVLHVDSFGNVVLNLNAEEWNEPLEAQKPHLQQYHMDVSLYSCYAQMPQNAVGIIPGSQGYLELACNRASAAKLLGLRPGHTLHLRL
ncbi:MAG: SAM-dependent chlorinase/fluorinase [Betaproteobacteria bacterium]|nr:SAM-dependent chlorinase/fluorinase [Betaproteobacteria bacterium]